MVGKQEIRFQAAYLFKDDVFCAANNWNVPYFIFGLNAEFRTADDFIFKAKIEQQESNGRD
jgi:hypothetical protein